VQIGWVVRAGLTVALAVLLALAGCSAKDGKVTGTVTIDGTPLESGSILFVPVDGKSPTTGGSIKEGRYSVRVPPGTMKVSISAPEVVGKKKIYPTADSPEMPVTKERLPPRYNESTELTLEVKLGTNEKDFELHSK
jgi:hypothetical protein